MAYSRPAPSTQTGIDIHAQSSLLFKHNPLSIWILDLASLAFLAVNDIAVRQYGFSRNQFLAMTLKDIVPNEGITEILEHAKSTAKTVTRASILKLSEAHSDLIDAELLCNEFIYEKRTALLVLSKVITEYKNAYESNFSSRDRCYKPITHSTDIISRVNRRLRVQNVNREIDQMTGMSWNELLGKTHTSLEISEDAVRQSSVYSYGSIFDLQQQLPPDAGDCGIAALSIPTRAWLPSWRRLILSLRVRDLALITQSLVHKFLKFWLAVNPTTNAAYMDGPDAIDISERRWYPTWVTMFRLAYRHSGNTKKQKQRRQPPGYRLARRISPWKDGGGIKS
ncbi:MAG: hypothetical protein ACYDCJ_11995 [Gammaproteobacteria bacterium]